MFNGALLNSDPNPSSVITLVQNITSFIASPAATSSASVVDIAVRLLSPDLKLIGAFAIIMMYDDMDFPLSGLLPQLESEKAVSFRPPFLYVMLESFVPEDSGESASSLPCKCSQGSTWPDQADLCYT